MVPANVLNPPSVAAFLERMGLETSCRVVRGEPMARHTTLRVGGPADLYFQACSVDELAAAALAAQRAEVPVFLLAGGSNICVSDRGIRGLVIHNLAREHSIGIHTRTATGYSLMSLFLDSLRAELGGLEFAVGIPGSVGGALVSNAGAYQQNIGTLVTALEVVEAGERKHVGPEWMEFSYRDSRLRRPDRPPAVLLDVSLRLEPKPRREILARARENQRQRIYKQPWYPSAGSFFKNVYSAELAQRVPGLAPDLRAKGIVPAGVLSAACGCKGLTVGGAQISTRHANFVINRGGATATDIYLLTREVKRRVREQFGVTLEEEVLFVGDWPELEPGSGGTGASSAGSEHPSGE